GAVGYSRELVQHPDLRAVAMGWSHRLDVPGLGVVDAVPVGVDDETTVVVAREHEPLDAEELSSVRAMGRVLVLTIRLLETVERQRATSLVAERQMAENESLLARARAQGRMLESNLRVQRLISQRQPVDEILQAITDEACELLKADLVGIQLDAPGIPGINAISTAGEVGERMLRALSSEHLVSLGRQAADGALHSARMMALPVHGDVAAPVTVCGAPVCNNGVSMGGLFLMSPTKVGASIHVDTAAVETFAGQASIALTDASTVHELHHAFHDTLTGLANRALFLDRLDHALAMAERRGSATALLFIDLDHFKSVNDSFGHAAGDELLRQVGAALDRSQSAYESAARLGGDEFAVLMEDTTPEQALALAATLQQSIRALEGPERSWSSPTSSIGVAMAEPGEVTRDELMRLADIAMYSVKHRGRSDVAMYSQPMGRTRPDNRGVANRLQVALDRGEFVVHYQPLISLRDRAVTGIEALVRWEDPDRGLVPPFEFIPAAEETGMIVDIGLEVLRQAATATARLRQDGDLAPDLKVSVNLSALQLEQDGIVDDVAAELQSSGLPTHALTLEVTESLFLVDAEASGRKLESLKGLGVDLAIDDFGTGFSSLQYIQRYPFDVLKIDRSFITGLGSAANSGAVVKNMLALGREMSMTTVAEGIETPLELAQLRALRCSHGQGYLFSKPIDLEALTRLLQRGIRIEA
ncbi:MAG: bifunctional diguanylate cyclase/phosphodiesterase, partial [Microthrixaceae bacterium]|nr:bifunctional diguanylate cyclase/phosphodiesterase [Microthrixaceae bacterium]